MNQKIIKLVLILAGLLTISLCRAEPISGTYTLQDQTMVLSKSCPSPVNSGIDFSDDGDTNLKYDSVTHRLQFIQRDAVLLDMILQPEGFGYNENIIKRENLNGKITLIISNQVKTNSFKVTAFSSIKSGSKSQTCLNEATFQFDRTSL